MKKHLLSAFFLSMTLISAAQAPSFQWARQMGGADYDSGNAVAVDAAGNVYTSGYFSGTADFDPGPGTATLTCAGSYDAFLSKFDASGNFVWVKQMAAGNSTSYIQSLRVDAAGNVYVGGVFDGTADFDPGVATNTISSTGSDDFFISKLDASGNLVWAKTMGGTGYDVLSAICVDASGNVYATGSFESAADFDPDATTYTMTTSSSGEIYVLKLNASGNFVWAKQLSGAGINVGAAITAGPSGKLYVSGNFENTVDFDPGASTYTLTAVGIYDSFILQLDAGGAFGWARQIGGAGEYAYGYGLATDATGNVYNTGTFSGTADLNPDAGTQNETSAGINDVYAIKLSSAGVFAWARVMGGTDDDYGYAIAVDASDNSYITGSFRDVADFDPGATTYTLAAQGDDDMFISKLDASGNLVWATGYGGSFSEVYGYGIYVDAASNVYATGSFNFVEDFDPSAATYTLSSVGFTDIFTLKLGQCVAPPAPVITSTTTAALTICSGNTASLTATGTGTLSWYATPTSTTVLATGSGYTTPALTTGTYTYYAGASTCTSSATRASVSVTVSACTGLEQAGAAKTELSMYPNPTNSKLYLKTSNPGNYTVRVYDVTGSLVLEQAADSELSLINMEVQSVGIYLVTVSSEGRVVASKKIIKE